MTQLRYVLIIVIHIISLNISSLEPNKVDNNWTKYLIECSLSKSQSMESELGSIRGIYGLAPNILSKALSLNEQEKVSSCLLARVNLMKRKVRILIFFDTKQHEDFYKHGGADLWVFEGAFWGNLFADDRPAFACYNKRLMEHRSLLSAAGRVCTISESESRSQCGFRVVGDCDELNSLSPGSKAYVWIPKFSQ